MSIHPYIFYSKNVHLFPCAFHLSWSFLLFLCRYYLLGMSAAFNLHLKMAQIFIFYFFLQVLLNSCDINEMQYTPIWCILHNDGIESYICLISQFYACSKASTYKYEHLFLFLRVVWIALIYIYIYLYLDLYR